MCFLRVPAFCKNTADSQWYTYDDTKVTAMCEEEVVTRAAYLLFYRRRPTAHPPTSDPGHWLHQLPKVQVSSGQPAVTQSRSHEDLLETHSSATSSASASPSAGKLSRTLPAKMNVIRFKEACMELVRRPKLFNSAELTFL